MSIPSTPQLRIGMSGWTYPPWRGVFYPEGWPQKRELEYASRQVSSIEINGTFYSLQRPKSYQAWHDATPDDFVFSVKAPRYITHILRLRDADTAVANFFASGIFNLGAKLGPILWQLPPSLQFDPEILDTFLSTLPHDTNAASELASHHDDKVKGRAVPNARQKRPLRHAMEVRHKSFECPEFIELLRKHNVALIIADTAGKWPFMEDVTSDFIYIRLHGDEKLYVSGYTDAALKEWARKIRSWSKGSNPTGTKRVTTATKDKPKSRDIHIYFDNDVKVRAPFDAMTLAHLLGVGDGPPSDHELHDIKEEARAHWPPLKKPRWQIGR